MDIFILLLTILTASICYFILKIEMRKLSYFERLKIPYVQPLPLLGNIAPIIFRQLSITEIIRNAYDKYSDVKYFGMFQFMTPIYVIRDPHLINLIAIKNFHNFCDRSIFVNKKNESMMGRILFILRGNQWHKMRKCLSPSFTSNKINIMFELMCHCAKNFTDFLSIDTGETGKTYDMQDVISRYANDVIATCAFGINVDSFKHPNNDFFLLAKETISLTNPRLFYALIMHRCFPKIAKFLKLRLLSKEVENFFKNIVIEVVKARNEKGIVRPDMIQLMMETRDNGSDSTFDIDEMTAQAFMFFLAGFETTAKNICFATHEIAMNPDIQSKLREEIEDVLKETNGNPTYETINSMKYLNAVVNETLRFYPPGAFLDRMCVNNFELPPATSNGKSVVLKPGDIVWFPVHALHHDSNYYCQPEKFDPKRFLNNEVNNSVFMPFGIGPRNCIGNRFALIEVKIMLFYLLWHCDLEPDMKTRNPIVLDKKALVLSAEGGFWLKLRAKKSVSVM